MSIEPATYGATWPLRDDRAGPVPLRLWSPYRPVAEAAGREPGSLSAAAHTVVEVAAMFEGTFVPDDLAAVLDQPVGPLLAAVHEMLAAELVVPRGRALAFRDGRTRAELAAAIPAALRGTLHRRIGAVLLDRGDVDAAAAQLTRGARPGDRAALAALDEVADRLLAQAPGTAADLAVLALELTGAGDAARHPRTVAAVEALAAAHRVGAATRLARDTLATPGTPPAAAARLQFTLCAVRLLHGDAAGAVADAAALMAGGQLAEDQRDGAQLIRLSGLLAAGDLAAAEAEADAALAGVQRPGSDAALAAGLSTLAWVAYCRGHLTTALDLARAAVQRSARGLPLGLRPELSLAAMLTGLGELDEAAEVLDRVGEDTRRPLDGLWAAAAPLVRARLHLAAGELDAATAQGRLALSLADELEAWLVVPLALVTLAQAALLRGDLDEAARHLERAEPGPALLPGGAETLGWTTARLAAARLGAAAVPHVLAAGQPTAAAPILLLQEPVAAELTRTALAAGEHEEARAVVARVEQLAAGNTGLRALRATADHVRGLLDRDPAAVSRAARTHRRPWSAGSAREDAGVLLAGADPAAARAEFELALEDYGRAGAERDAARVRSRLRELGARPCHWSRADRPASGWESLTDSERRVADAVAEGLTNRQAGERLFLSRHTVDFHLRQIFLKLGIRSRVELTRLVVQHGEQGVEGIARTT